MINFCPNCGSKLDKEYKFCPNCGINLSEVKPVENTYIICDNCGEENQPQNEVCISCGAKLQGEEIKKTEVKAIPPADIVNEKKVKPAPKSTPKKRKEAFAEPPAGKGEKQLSPGKIIIILSVIFAAILIILIASGVFESGQKFETNVANNQSSAVDLSHIEEINQLEERVKANPKDSSALLQLAHLRNDSGFLQKAIETYQQYLDMVPSDADARIDMGVCYYNLKEYDKATEAMETALKYNPDHQIGHLNLGIVNLAAGNLEKSKEWLQRAVNINPNSEIGKRAQELLMSH